MATIIVKEQPKPIIPEGSAMLQIIDCDDKHLRDFIDSQRKGLQVDGTYKKKGITAEGALNLREETKHILSHCNPSDKTDVPQATHLAVGYVQSGKTMSFTSLIALALDCKYRLVIVLAGTKNNLLDQTTKRLKKDLMGKDGRNRDHYVFFRNPTSSDLDDITSHISDSDDTIVVVTVLKNPSPLKKLNDLLRKPQFQDAIKKHSAIIIDDEADQASLNAFARKKTVDDETDQDNKNKSATYRAILKMRGHLPGNSYVQYTATPQANILINMADFLSPKTHTLLTPGEDYVGGKKFFGRAENSELFQGNLIVRIPAEDVFDKKKPHKTLPQTLINALMFHILAVAVKVYYEKSEDVKYLSMMLHIDQTKEWNRQFHSQVRSKISEWRKTWNKSEGDIDKVEFRNELRSIFPEVVKLYDEDLRPTFEEVEVFIKKVLQSSKVHLVISDVEDKSPIDWDSSSSHILVGAEMLNRGYTVNNLSTTFMPRHSKTAPNSDTIQQRCRFFGYKMDYIELCRVFLPTVSIIHYNDYIDFEENMHNVLRSTDSLSAIERTLTMSEKLKPTRNNVLPKEVVTKRLSGLNHMKLFDSPYQILQNNKRINRFIDKHIAEFDYDTYKYDTATRSHRQLIIPVHEAIELLDSMNIISLDEKIKIASTVRLLKYMSESECNNPITHVCFIQIGWNDVPKERTLKVNHDDDNDITVHVFTGQSNAGDKHEYPGDKKCVHPELLTIQLHNIQFRDPVDAEFMQTKNAYTLAINYPDSLSNNYCFNLNNF